MSARAPSPAHPGEGRGPEPVANGASSRLDSGLRRGERGD